MSRNIHIPDGFRELLQEFTVAVIRNQPRDLCDFASQYFTDLRRKEKEEKGQALKSNIEAMMYGSDGEENDEDEFVGN